MTKKAKQWAYAYINQRKSGLKSSCCNNESSMQMSVSAYCHVSFGLELIMLRAGFLYLYTPDCEWSRVLIDCMLTAIGTR